MNIESIVIHTDIKEKLDLLSDAEAGQLFKAIIAYAKDGTIFSPDDNRVLGVIFLFVKDQIERDYAKYLEKSGKEDRRSEANRKNANKRWQKAKECNGNANECNGSANASEEMQADATESLPNSIPIITPNRTPNSISSDKEGKAKRFTKPTLQEIEEYVKEMGWNDDPGAIYDHYEANGWKQSGGNGIKDWKAAVRNWHRRSGSFGQAPQTRELSFKSDKGDNPAKEDYGKKDYSMRFGTTTKEEKKNWGERF